MKIQRIGLERGTIFKKIFRGNQELRRERMQKLIYTLLAIMVTDTLTLLLGSLVYEIFF